MLKRFNIILSTLVLFISFLLISCKGDDNDNQYVKNTDRNQIKKKLEEVNKALIQKEMEEIDKYLEKHNLNMIRTGSGLRYCIDKQGDTSYIQAGDIVVLDYELYFLNNEKEIASSKNDAYKTFLVGHGGVEIGLEEAILNLHKGDEATIIIPSYLAYGLIGDGYRIPPQTTLVYKVKVIENQTKK